MVLAAGGRPGGAHHLHGQATHKKAVGHGLIGGQVPLSGREAVVPDALGGVRHDVVDALAEVLPGEEMGHPPVRQGHELPQYVPHTAGGEVSRGLGDDIQVRRHQDGGLAGHGGLVALPGHGRHGGAETVTAGGGGDGHEGQPLILGAVADDIVDGTAAHRQKDLNIRPELAENLRCGDLRRMETPGVQDDLLLRLGMPQLRDGIGMLIIDGAAAQAREAHLRQVPFQVFRGSRLNDAEPGVHGVVPAAGAAPTVFLTLDPHRALPFLPRETGDARFRRKLTFPENSL